MLQSDQYLQRHKMIHTHGLAHKPLFHKKAGSKFNFFQRKYTISRIWKSVLYVKATVNTPNWDYMNAIKENLLFTRQWGIRASRDKPRSLSGIYVSSLRRMLPVLESAELWIIEFRARFLPRNLNLKTEKKTSVDPTVASYSTFVA